MYCSQCGAKIADGAKFCHQCGQSVPTSPVETSRPEQSEQLLLKVIANLFRGWESVGGKLSITNKKLHFKSHSFNIQTGETILCLNEIVEVRKVNTAGIVPNGLLVRLKNGNSFQFVVSKRNQVYDTIVTLLKY